MTLHVVHVKINGKKLAVVAALDPKSYAPEFQRPSNRFSVFVTGNVLHSRGSRHATFAAARAEAYKLASRVNGAFYPTRFGDAPF